MNEEYVPGRDDPSTVQLDERIQRYAAYLREVLTFDEAILQLAGHAIMLKEVEEKMPVLKNEIGRSHTDLVEKYGDVCDMAIETVRRARRGAERFKKVLNTQIAKRAKVSAEMTKAGIKSGQLRSRNAKATPEKVGALLRQLSPLMDQRNLNSAIAQRLSVTPEMIRRVRKEMSNQT